MGIEVGLEVGVVVVVGGGSMKDTWLSGLVRMRVDESRKWIMHHLAYISSFFLSHFWLKESANKKRTMQLAVRKRINASVRTDNGGKKDTGEERRGE